MAQALKTKILLNHKPLYLFLRPFCLTLTSNHSKKFEPPLPLCVGLKIQTLSRSKTLISELSQLGLSVTYDRVLHIERQIASSLCEQGNETGVVCPSLLPHGLFTAGAFDNLDYNPSNTTAKESFHGTTTTPLVLQQRIPFMELPQPL